MENSCHPGHRWATIILLVPVLSSMHFCLKSYLPYAEFNRQWSPAAIPWAEVKVLLWFIKPLKAFSKVIPKKVTHCQVALITIVVRPSLERNASNHRGLAKTKRIGSSFNSDLLPFYITIPTMHHGNPFQTSCLPIQTMFLKYRTDKNHIFTWIQVSVFNLYMSVAQAWIKVLLLFGNIRHPSLIANVNLTAF